MIPPGWDSGWRVELPKNLYQALFVLAYNLSEAKTGQGTQVLMQASHMDSFCGMRLRQRKVGPYHA